MKKENNYLKLEEITLKQVDLPIKQDVLNINIDCYDENTGYFNEKTIDYLQKGGLILFDKTINIGIDYRIGYNINLEKHINNDKVLYLLKVTIFNKSTEFKHTFTYYTKTLDDLTRVNLYKLLSDDLVNETMYKLDQVYLSQLVQIEELVLRMALRKSDKINSGLTNNINFDRILEPYRKHFYNLNKYETIAELVRRTLVGDIDFYTSIDRLKEFKYVDTLPENYLEMLELFKD